MVAVEGQERLHVDDLGLDPHAREIGGGFQGDPAQRAVGHERHVRANADRFGHAERDGELADVLGQPLLEPVSREHLDEDRRVVSAEQRVVDAGRASHVARHRDVEPAKRRDDRGHRRPGVPDPLQSMTLGADQHRGFLTAAGAPVQRREVVGRQLEGVEQVVDVLDVHNRAQPAQGRADSLPEDRRLAYAGIDDALIAVLRLQSLEDEVDVAEFPDVLAEDDDAWITREVVVEASEEHDAAIHRARIVGVGRCHGADPKRRLGRSAVQVRVEELVVLFSVGLDESGELVTGDSVAAAKRRQRAARRRCDETPARWLGRPQLLHARVEIRSALRGGRFEDREGLLAIGADRREIRIPSVFADALDLGTHRALELVERRRVSQLFANDPLAHPAYRIELDLEAQAVLRLVPLVRTARRVALRLRHLGDVHHGGDVVAARALGSDLVHVEARDVVVTLHGVEVQPRATFLATEALEHGRDRALRRLELVRHRDPVAVIPHRDHERDLEHSGGVEALPEHAFARARVADRGEADLFPIA